MSKNNPRKYVSGSRSAHVSNFGSAVTHCDGRSRNHRNYISRRADCFESVGDDRRITDVKCEVVKNHIVGVLINGSDFLVVTHRDHRRADCFESVGDDRGITDVKWEVVKNNIVGVLINGSEFLVVTYRDHWKM